MNIDFKKLYISEQAIKKRLAYIRGQIEKCEGEIPSKLWCKDCKRRIKKIQCLLDKLAESIKVSQRPSKPRKGDFSEFYDHTSYTWPSKKTDYDSYSLAYVCVDCRINFPGTHMVYDRKEDLVHDDYNGKWRCPVCDSDKVVGLTYSSKGCIERDLNDGDDEVSIPSNMYRYECLDCGAGYVKKEDLSKTWKLVKSEWTCPKCRGFNIVYIDDDGGEQRLNED